MEDSRPHWHSVTRPDLQAGGTEGRGCQHQTMETHTPPWEGLLALTMAEAATGPPRGAHSPHRELTGRSPSEPAQLLLVLSDERLSWDRPRGRRAKRTACSQARQASRGPSPRDNGTCLAGWTAVRP